MRSVRKKTKGLLFLRTGRVIQEINTLLYDKNESIPENFAKNFSKNHCYKIFPKSFSQDFLLIVKCSENCPKTD